MFAIYQDMYRATCLGPGKISVQDVTTPECVEAHTFISLERLIGLNTDAFSFSTSIMYSTSGLLVSLDRH